MKLHELKKALAAVLLGKDDVIHLGLTCLLANGHLLLEDIPGMGKTTFSHALAELTGMNYRRIQFTSDLLPSDVLGVSIFDSQLQQFHFHQGPIFSQLVLADEINRATPRTQSALLEAMEERQVTTDDGTHVLPEPFFVIATQNPAHQMGTYALPESQLDRFLMCLRIGYPSAIAERELLQRDESTPSSRHLQPIIDVNQLRQFQVESQQVHVADLILDYIQALLAASREHEWFRHGLSPRAGLALIKASKAFARLNDRDFVAPDDVQAILAAVVNHRLISRSANPALSPAELLLQHVTVPI